MKQKQLGFIGVIVVIGVFAGVAGRWFGRSHAGDDAERQAGLSMAEIRSLASGGGTVAGDTMELLMESVDGENVHLVDIRTYEELMETGVIGDPQHVDYYDAATPGKIAQRDKDDIYLLYCRTGNRSDALRTYMRNELDMPYVVDLDGGIVQRAGDINNRPCTDNFC